MCTRALVIRLPARVARSTTGNEAQQATKMACCISHKTCHRGIVAAPRKGRVGDATEPPRRAKCCVKTRGLLVCVNHSRRYYESWSGCFRCSSELHCHYHFSGSRERGVSPLTRYTHRSLRQAPTYLAHTSTVSLSPLDISRVLNQYRLQSSQITKLPNGTAPFDSSNSEVM